MAKLRNGRAGDADDTPPDDGDSGTLAPDRLGAHLKRLREVRRLTQDELAKLAGLAADTIRRLEHGDFSPSLRTLERVAAALDITLTALFGSHELAKVEITREFADLLATRAPSEQSALARLWRDLAARLDRRRGGAPAPTNPDSRDKPTGDPFGRHVRLLRRARGMTQEELAAACGLSPDTIRRLEHGSFSPSLDTLTKMCRGLQLCRSTLFLSFEEGERDIDRELADVLGSRSIADRALGLGVLRLVFELLEELDDPS